MKLKLNINVHQVEAGLVELSDDELKRLTVATQWQPGVATVNGVTFTARRRKFLGDTETQVLSSDRWATVKVDTFLQTEYIFSRDG